MTPGATRGDDSRPTTVGDLLREAVDRFPDRTALVFAAAPGGARQRWTYRELLAESLHAAARLQVAHQVGDRIAVWAENCPEWLFTQFGVALAGLVLVPLNPLFTTDEAAYVLQDSGACTLLHDGVYRDSRPREVADLLARVPRLSRAARLTDGQPVPDSPPTPDLPAVLPDWLAQISYTSGTTGVPKGVLLHHRGLTLTPRVAAELLQLGPAPRWLNIMPMFHVGGSGLPVIGSLSLGGTHILAGRYHPDLVLELLQHERASFFGGVPTMLLDLLARYDPARHDLSALHVVMSGGASVSPDLIRQVQEQLGVDFVVAYGQTEAHGHITQTRREDTVEHKATTVGLALPHIELRVVTERGEDAGPGVPGELWCRSAAVMPGYHDNPVETHKALVDGWLRTGDLCTADADGRCTFVGRTGDVIRRGGEKVAPREVEDVLCRHPAVEAAAVVGVPDVRLGERVVAFVQRGTGHAGAEEQADGEQLAAHVRRSLAGYKTPDHWTFVDQLPRNASGKVLRTQLQQCWLAARSED